MREEKLILEKQTKYNNDGLKPVFIDSAVYKQVVELKNETGIPIRQIINRFIDYALDNVEIKDGK